MSFRTLMTAATVLGGLYAMPAFAQDQAAPVKEKKICRREETTGSILGSRPVCHTKSEWAAIDEANKRNADDSMDRARNIQNNGVGNTRNN